MFQTDNPFYDGAGPNKDEIWARGFRNPFRFSFDSATGRLYEGDVGQDDWEEVNIVTKGANYGWPTCEGTCGNAGMTDPIYTYNHNGRDASITGGFVYRGNQFPSLYQGSYFFADYAQNWIRRLTLDSNGNSTGVQNFEPNTNALDGAYGEPVAMTMGPDGSLYYVDIGPFQTTGTGKIRKITFTTANQPPTAQASASVTSGQTAPLTVNFSSAGSSDPESQPIAYAWNFGDSTSSTQANPSHTYNSSGIFTAQLTVSDGTNSVLAAPITINIGRPPTATIATPVNNFTFQAGQTISFSGSGTDPEDGNLAANKLTWSVVFHHEGHIHPGPGPFTGTSGSFSIPLSGHDFSGNTSYEITLTAVDSTGLQTSTSVFIYPQKVNVTYNTSPSGMSLVVDGSSQTTPLTVDSLVGFSHTLDATTPQILNSTRYKFSSWSDSGAQSHSFTTPTSARSYVATYAVDNSLPAGLSLALGLDQGSGTTATDFSGNGNNGTLSGASWTVSGKYGSSLSFNVSSNFVTINDSNSLDISGNGTLEAWVSLSAVNRWNSILAKGNANTNGVHNYALEVDNSNHAKCLIGNGSIFNEVNSATTLSANIFYHLACSWDGSTVRVYINGVQDSIGSQTVTAAANISPLYIGQFGGNTDRLQGTIDEVRIYSRALSQPEIQSDMNSAISGSTPPPVPPPVPPPTPPPSATPIPGDLNTDHVINALDFSLLNSRWNQNFPSYDLVVDSLINSLDFAVMSSNWGRTW